MMHTRATAEAEKRFVLRGNAEFFSREVERRADAQGTHFMSHAFPSALPRARGMNHVTAQLCAPPPTSAVRQPATSDSGPSSPSLTTEQGREQESSC